MAIDGHEEPSRGGFPFHVGGPRPAAERLSRRLRALLWGIALVAGAAFRLPFLLDETPHYDEWHPLLAVKRQKLEKLATTFGKTDRSIPVALYLEGLTRTVGLSDLPMRLPFALAGLALLVAVPLAAKSKQQPEATAPAFALFLALSPLLVYYSRSIRPYGFSVLISFLGIFVLRRALAPGSPRRWIWLYVAAAALVGWFLPVHFPFVVTPLLVAAFERARRDGLRAAFPAIGIGLRVGAALLVLLGPALLRDSGSLAEKAGAGGFDLYGLLATPSILCGTHSRLITGAWIALAIWSAVAAFRRSDEKLRLLTVAAFGQLAAVVVARPWLVDEPVVLSRYLLPCGVVAWLLVADLLQRAVARSFSPEPGYAAIVAPLLVGFLLYANGPLRGWLGTGPDNFASTRLHDHFWGGGESAAPGSWLPAPPAFYRRIEELPPRSAAVLEVPYSGYLSEPYAYYQLRHRQVVYLGVVADFCAPHNTIELPAAGDRGFELERFLALGDVTTLREKGVRFVLLHRHSERKVGEVYLRNTFFNFDRCTEAFAKASGVTPEVDERGAWFDLGAPPAVSP